MQTDVKHVRELTNGNAIIMGRRTFDSIGHALAGRQNIVVSHQPVSAPDVTYAATLDEAYAAVEPGRDAYIFGGGQLYAAALDTVDEIRATEVDAEIEGADAFFPALGPEWQEVSRERHDSSDDDIYPFDFVTYKK